MNNASSLVPRSAGDSSALPRAHRPRSRTTTPATHHSDRARWLKFNLVGGLGMAVQLAALATFHSVLKLDYRLATPLAVEIAVVQNYLWHERFTWRDRPSSHPLQSLVRFIYFNLTNGAVSLAGNLLIMAALLGQLHWNYAIANLLAIAVCSLANFLLSDRFVFPHAKG